jgi:mannose-6-phosphate isomerase-like protein (cupin superfamily)
MAAGRGDTDVCVGLERRDPALRIRAVVRSGPWRDPGHGAPTHLHAVEEIVRVFEGQAEVWSGEARVTLTAGQLVVVPAGRKHGFSNGGKTVLRIQSTLAEPVFEAAYDDKRETPRRWLPG